MYNHGVRGGLLLFPTGSFGIAVDVMHYLPKNRRAQKIKIDNHTYSCQTKRLD